MCKLNVFLVRKRKRGGWFQHWNLVTFAFAGRPRHPKFHLWLQKSDFNYKQKKNRTLLFECKLNMIKNTVWNVPLESPKTIRWNKQIVNSGAKRKPEGQTETKDTKCRWKWVGWSEKGLLYLRVRGSNLMENALLEIDMITKSAGG